MGEDGLFNARTVQLNRVGGAAAGDGFLCSSPAGRSPFCKPPYPAPTVSCPRPQAWTAGKLENRRRSGVAPWQGGGLHAHRVRVVS